MAGGGKEIEDKLRDILGEDAPEEMPKRGSEEYLKLIETGKLKLQRRKADLELESQTTAMEAEFSLLDQEVCMREKAKEEEESMVSKKTEGMASFIPYHEEIMRILETDKSLKATIVRVGKQAACAAAGTVLGGLSAGRPGAVVGGIAGVAVGYHLVDDYDTMLEVLRKMPEKDKKRLVQEVQELVKDVHIDAFLLYIRLPHNKAKFAELIKSFK